MGRTRIDRDKSNPVDIYTNDDGNSYGYSDSNGNSGSGFRTAADALDDAKKANDGEF